MKRRDLLKHGALGVAGLAAASKVIQAGQAGAQQAGHLVTGHLYGGAVGDVTNPSVDPMLFLEHFDYGKVTRLPGGKTLREYELFTVDREIEVAPGVFYPA